MSSELQKHIDTKGLVAYYVSSVVGVGILIIPGIAAQIAGPASLLAWIFLALISVPVAFSFAKMAILVPDSGGVPSFIEKYLNKEIGKSLSILLTITMIFGNPVMGLTTAQYLRNLLGFESALIPWVGFCFMLLSIAFNLIGIRSGTKIQSLSLFFLIAGLVVVIVIALPVGKLENITPFFSHGIGSIGGAMVVCFFSFLGWENVSSIAEEVDNPGKTFRRAIPWAILCVGGLYCLIAWVYLTVVPPSHRADNPTVLTPILRFVFGNTVAILGDIAAILLLVLATNSWVMGASRLIYALGRNRLIPNSFGKISQKNNVPIYSLCFLAGSYGLITALIAVAGLSEQWLIKIANANFMLIYLCAFWTGLKTFRSLKMKMCAFIAILATASFLPFFGSMMLLSGLLAVLAFLWTRSCGSSSFDIGKKAE
jgi:amino acid efflux transporter